MSETIATTNPNIGPTPEQEHQAALLINEIMDNPQRVGASVEDGSYAKTETENEVREKIDVGKEQSSVKLRVSRVREHDPERHLRGKHSETLTMYSSIPGIAQLNLVMVDGKVWSVEYADPFVNKNTNGNIDGLEESTEAIRLAIEELSS